VVALTITIPSGLGWVVNADVSGRSIWAHWKISQKRWMEVRLLCMQRYLNGACQQLCGDYVVLQKRRRKPTSYALNATRGWALVNTLRSPLWIAPFARTASGRCGTGSRRRHCWESSPMHSKQGCHRKGFGIIWTKSRATRRYRSGKAF